MKKIENVLIPPILVLIVLIFITRSTTLDIHLHDTYFIIAHAQLAKWFLYWMVVVFLLYTVIRYRHKRVNKIWAIAHIGLSIVLMAFILFVANYTVKPAEPSPICGDEWSYWFWFNEMIITGVLAFLLTQIVFLIYFVTRLFARV